MLLYESHNSDSKKYFRRFTAENMNIVEHIHSSFELVYVRKGNLETLCGDTLHNLREGKAALIFPNQIHAYKTPVYSLSQVMIFSADLVESFYRATVNKLPEDPVFEVTNKTFFDEFVHDNNKDIYMIQSFLYYICAEFNRNARWCDRTLKDDNLLNKLIDYIQNNFTKQVSLRELSREFGYDYCYLSRFFADNIGMSFKKFLNEHRINYAQYLLKTNPHMSVSEIAFSSGFESFRNFNRVFLSLTEMTPSAYRKISD